MNLDLQVNLGAKFHSKSQIARVLTEDWFERNMFCPRCGHPKCEHFENNKPVAVFFCPRCESQYELKSKNGLISSKYTDGAYEKMIERITSGKSPDFFFLSYSLINCVVTDFLFVPNHFFIPDVIEKRPPLAPTARRAGWVGCNILLGKIPIQGRIDVIKTGQITSKERVVAKVANAKRLQLDNIKRQGWLLDVLNCVNMIPNDDFTLDDVYQFESALSQKRPENNNIRAKIRQQLQILRDKGFPEFKGKGTYRKTQVCRS